LHFTKDLITSLTKKSAYAPTAGHPARAAFMAVVNGQSPTVYFRLFAAGAQSALFIQKSVILLNRHPILGFKVPSSPCGFCTFAAS
jgi:hypothetical protein